MAKSTEIDFKQVAAEKGSIIAVGLGLTAFGLDLIKSGQYIKGFCCIGFGAGLIYLREYLKNHRWSRLKK